VTFGLQHHQTGVAFGDILQTFGNPFGVSGPPGSDLATESIFGHFPDESLTPLGYIGILLAPNIATNHKTHKRTVS